MKRLALEKLKQWKSAPHRKPLLLQGVRQSGKTWLLKEFGRCSFKNTAYFNFEENSDYKQFFEATKDVHRLIQNLEMASGQTIRPDETLLIFDEIQNAPDALGALKYFCENAPEYHVTAAGSLLGVALAKPSSFPVGKVEFLFIHPMNFTEFLLANGDERFARYLAEIDELSPLPDAFYHPLVEKLKMYYVTGGMPEAVLRWTEEHSVEAVQGVLFQILEAYERDFSKHPDAKEYPKLSLVWRSLPSQLARENKRFLYKVVKEGARAREYEDAVQWLANAGLVQKIYRVSKPGLPLSAYDDLSAFKLYTADVGLLRRMAQLAPSAFAEGNRLFTEFKGALTENYALTALLPQFEGVPRYWSQNNPSYEVDFLVQQENTIIPVEVKADTNLKSRSLKKFKELFGKETNLRVRLSLENLKYDDGVLNVPLFMADQAGRLMEMAKG